MLKEEKDTQEIISGGCSKDTMTSDFSMPQFHAINNGSSVIINFNYLWCFRILTDGYNILILLCIRVCALYK